MTSWLDREEYPFASRYLEVEGGRMHYLDEGKGPVLLMVHGTPAWSFLYRRLVKALAPEYRCIAMDHLGFGLSDKPAKMEYSVGLHGDNLQALIDHLQLRDITLMVHDFGGPIGLGRVIARPELFAQLIVCNTWLWSSFDEERLAADPEARKMKKLLSGPLLPFLYRYLNFSARVLLPKAFADKSKLTRALHKQYLKPLSSPGERMGALAFARSLVAEDASFESLWEQRRALAHLPTLLLWGLGDPFLGPELLKRWRTFLEEENRSERTRIVELQKVGHFIQEEAPLEVEAQVRAFLQNGAVTVQEPPSSRA